MSYLDVPRLHFAGEVFADPSTVNNRVANYDPAVVTPVPGWNRSGEHHFEFKSCTVRRVLDKAGNVHVNAASDPLVGGAVETSVVGRLVDLDPEKPEVSQIWGLEIKVSPSAGGDSFQGKMETATLRDLWAIRAPQVEPILRFGGVYQSTLTGITWTPAGGPVASKVFGELRGAATLSIKFVVYAYDPRSVVSGLSNPKFLRGKIVGTIGPASPSEPEHFSANRLLLQGGSDPFGTAPFKVDAGRRKLVIDLGNAVPETAPGGPRRALGTMEATVTVPPAGPTVIGPLVYDQAHYEETAGIEELSLTAPLVAQLDTHPLNVQVTGPPLKRVLMERPRGTFVDATEIALRINPGKSESIQLIATEFGKPKPGQTLSLKRLQGTPSGALSFPATVTTEPDGRKSVTFTTGDPGTPRLVDGQLYELAFHWGSSPVPLHRRGSIFVLVFSAHPVPAAPTWSHVEPIFRQYAKLYPSMKAVRDLSDHAMVTSSGWPAAIKAALLRDLKDPKYMPVTRDLSEDKKKLIIKWIDAGAPP